MIEEFDNKNRHIAVLCYEDKESCTETINEFKIVRLRFYDKSNRLLREIIGDTKEYLHWQKSLLKKNNFESYKKDNQGILIDPFYNLDIFTLIKNNFFYYIDKSLLSKNKNVYLTDFYHDNKIMMRSNVNNHIIETIIDISLPWNNVNTAIKRIFLISISILIFLMVIFLYNAYYIGYIMHDLKESKIKAETENSEKTEFLSNVSHELRTPLNSIIGFSEIIIQNRDNKISPQHQNYIENIYQSGKHLLSIINDLLDFQKASASKLNIEFMDVDVNKIAVSSMNFLKPKADSNNITLEVKKPNTHTIISADPKRLKQALLNLISNSVKFTPDKGKVTVEIIPDDKHRKAIIKIIDNGIGIHKNDLPKVLSGFHQIDNRLNRKYQGTGIGLPLTKKLVELMHGSFKIESIPEVGTTVTLEFKSVRIPD